MLGMMSPVTAFEGFLSAVQGAADRARGRGDDARATEIEDGAGELVAAMEAFEVAMETRASLGRDSAERSHLFRSAARRLDVAVARCRDALTQAIS
jgi:hypothetical protein